MVDSLSLMVSFSLNSMSSSPANSLNRAILAAKSASLLPAPKLSSVQLIHKRSLATKAVESVSSLLLCKSDASSVKEQSSFMPKKFNREA